mmetsp:Transcript_107112/g.345838  ORF Transcript_107112/g.345838 Transcript_107112/m.345838 type:complete len:90 (+) Transcript_107112:1562-1831(+)|eukprot:CAMPEP_0203907220 /NCGR_PEP_ID=MMETSP0359-20131031/48741_1 /ASSEMBLY_ACC=CAM_ASM_000338 /TAXON_ID=268821 /ORGANISM="Scrippsiella Hangoei, Strain SHTV-5" /LENGTH=89 /DNA_ID=CAMNT_0050831999 /DNA_START=159 /DNA_END=428 /DNA_ORIENTATION=-
MCCPVFRACFGGMRRACAAHVMSIGSVEFACVRFGGSAFSLETCWPTLMGDVAVVVSALDAEAFEVRRLWRTGCGSVFCIDGTCAGANP